jgi:hypothetical protein
MRGKESICTKSVFRIESETNRKTSNGYRFLSAALLVLLFFSVGGCGVINPGKWKGIETTSSDEQHWLLKDSFLTAGSAAHARDDFDHTMQESVNVVFVAANEKNEYTVQTRWYDPSGQEFREIRRHYDVKAESKEGAERKKGGTPRVHSMPTKELADHKAGMWKVAIILDGKLARRLSFSVR